MVCQKAGVTHLPLLQDLASTHNIDGLQACLAHLTKRQRGNEQRLFG